MTALSQNLTQLTNGKRLRNQLLRGGIGSIAIKVTFTCLGMAQTILLARILGPSNYGVFAYVFALVAVLAVPTNFGLPILMVRETARGQADGDLATVNGIWRWSILIVCGISLVLAAAALIGLWFTWVRFSPLQIETFLWGLLLVPMLALSNMAGAALRGLRYIVQGQLPESIFRPALFIGLILVIVLLSQELTASNAMMLRVLASCLALALGLWLLLRQKVSRTALRSPAKYKPRAWFNSVLPLALTAGFRIVIRQTDIVLLGLFVTTEMVGEYNVALRGVVVLAVALQAIDQLVAPYFARLHQQGNLKQLQRIARVSARGVFLLTLPIAVTFVVFGKPIIGLVFGNEYMAAATPLAILSAGWLAGSFFGSAGFLLSMTGYEKDSLRCAGVAALSNVAFNLILIPPFGMNGAAIATACCLVLWKGLITYMAYKRIGVVSWAI